MDGRNDRQVDSRGGGETDGSPHRAHGASRLNSEGRLATQGGRPPALGGRAYSSSEPRRVPDHEPGAGRGGEVPPGTGALRVADGVPAQAGDLGKGVAAVGVDGDPFAGPRCAPALQLAGGEGAGDEAAAEEGEADRSRAVVTVGVEGAMAAAPYIGAADDHVGVVDRPLH